jgi:serine/threonine protein kinase
MIDQSKVRKGDKIYGDPTGTTAVFLGTYYFNSEERQVAIKTLMMKDAQQMMQITQEMILQTRLEGCESICKLYGYYMEGNSVSIVSERLGQDLEKYIKTRCMQRSSFSEMEILSMLEQVLVALRYAKEKVNAKVEYRSSRFEAAKHPFSAG